MTKIKSGAKRSLTDFSDNIDDALVDAGVRADLEEGVGAKPRLEKWDEGRTLEDSVLKFNTRIRFRLLLQ